MGTIEGKQKTAAVLFPGWEPLIGKLFVVIDRSNPKLQVITRGPIGIAVREQSYTVLIIVRDLTACQKFTLTAQQPFTRIYVDGDRVAPLIGFGAFQFDRSAGKAAAVDAEPVFAPTAFFTGVTNGIRCITSLGGDDEPDGEIFTRNAQGGVIIADVVGGIGFWNWLRPGFGLWLRSGYWRRLRPCSQGV